MKKILLAIGAIFLVSASSYAVESKMWRLTFTNTIGGDSVASVSEIELLYDPEIDISGVDTGAEGTFTLDSDFGDVSDNFSVGDTFEVADSTGNDGTYTVVSSTYSAGSTVLGIAVTEYDINAVTTGAGGTFSFASSVGNVASSFPAGAEFEVTDSTGNDGTYTVDSATYSAITEITTITIDSGESIPNSTADGTISISILNGTPDGTVSPTELVDALRSDEGVSVCDAVATGWACDSISTSRRGTPSRQIERVIDNNVTSSYETSDRISDTTTWPIQYTFYLGTSAPNRTLPDIEGYSITVEEDVILDKAPNSWTLEYYDADAGSWASADEELGTGISFGNGTEIENVGGDTVARKLTFTF